ncbi:hypothetical protein P167DRAFT_314810 [Morchella conica CCBAS932]|uniref:Uncharacterized protein n=1 Tax=Morchella conica CCBAS932 TaxID=1392247 RepID=A0A3N4L4B4_9PEZI|nr:hypothetical protein P167DRAFT_314810 [Morchella conica CCBAS932]
MSMYPSTFFRLLGCRIMYGVDIPLLHSTYSGSDCISSGDRKARVCIPQVYRVGAVSHSWRIVHHSVSEIVALLLLSALICVTQDCF